MSTARTSSECCLDLFTAFRVSQMHVIFHKPQLGLESSVCRIEDEGDFDTSISNSSQNPPVSLLWDGWLR